MRKRRLYRTRAKHYLIVPTIVYGVLLLSISSADAYEIFPPHYGLTGQFIGTASESYSSNIRFAEDNNNKIEDFVTDLSIGLNLRFTGKKRKMGLFGNINRQIRSGSGDVDNRAESLTANFTNELSEYDRIGLSNTFTHTQVPGSFRVEFVNEECERLRRRFGGTDVFESECKILFEEEFGRLRGRLDQYDNRTTLQYNREISKYFDFGTTYTYGKYWSDEEGTTDSHRNSIDLTARYYHSERINFPLSYSYDDSNSGEGERTYIQRLSAGMDVRITEYLSIGANYGANLSSVKGKRTTNENFDFSLMLSEEYLIDRKSTVSVNYSRGVFLAPDRDEIFDNWRITANLRRDFLEALSGIFSLFYGEGKFISEGVTDKLIGTSIELTYKILEYKSGVNMNANLGYTYSDLNSTDENRGYARSTINGGVTARF